MRQTVSRSIDSSASEEITTPSAAAMLGLSIPRVQQLFRAGEIEARKVSKRGWVTTRRAVEDYRAAQQSKANL